MRTSRHGVVLAAALVGVTASGGCSGAAPAEPAPTGPEAFAYLAGYPDGGDDAALDGTLAERAGCLLVIGDGETVIPTFPSGQASWDGERLTIASFGPDGERDGQVVAPGGEIHLGGGFRDSLAGLDATVPPGCPDDAPYFLVAALP